MRFSTIAASLAVVGSAVAVPAFASGLATSEGLLVNYCGTPDDSLQISSLEISPDPPVPGKDLTIKAKGTLKQTIEQGAYASVQVKLGRIKILSKNFDLCEESPQVDLQCPIKDGELVIEKTVRLPKDIPPARFTIHTSAYTADDDEITCLIAKFDLTGHQSSTDL